MSEFSKKAMEEIKAICEEANKRGISMELPTHDHMTITGRFRRDVFEFSDIMLKHGLRSLRQAPPIGADKIIQCDYANLELRIMSHWARNGRIAPGDFFFDHLWMIMPDPFEDRNEGGVE